MASLTLVYRLVTVPVSTPGDTARARREARALAMRAGLDDDSIEAVVLAVSELGTNLVRYGREGQIVLRRIGEDGVQIESIDRGPGIDDPRKALRDRFSTGSGLGGGLGAVRRLMDEFEIIRTGPDGTHIRAVKWPG